MNLILGELNSTGGGNSETLNKEAFGSLTFGRGHACLREQADIKKPMK